VSGEDIKVISANWPFSQHGLIEEIPTRSNWTDCESDCDSIACIKTNWFESNWREQKEIIKIIINNLQLKIPVLSC
jgi:hypothetical protein